MRVELSVKKKGSTSDVIAMAIASVSLAFVNEYGVLYFCIFGELRYGTNQIELRNEKKEQDSTARCVSSSVVYQK